MNLGELPPEIVSAQIHSGPGPASILAAASAWDALSTELQLTASAYGAIIERLVSESWTGPSSAAMAAAALPFATWISATAEYTKAAANQARAAAAAFEAVFAATVPPAQVLANRSQLLSLTATNIFGQNTAAIAATESQYSEMWAQDSAAMFAYAGSSAVASRLHPFPSAPRITDPSGTAVQAAAVSQSDGLSGATEALSGAAAAWPYEIVSDLLQTLATSATVYHNEAVYLLNTITGIPTAAANYQNLLSIAGSVTRFAAFSNISIGLPNFGMGEYKFFWTAPVAVLPDVPKAGLGAGLGARPTAFTSTVAASLADANMVGKLSVPPTWAGATPSVRLAASALPATTAAAAPASAIPGDVLGQMAQGSLAGGALGDVPRILSGSVRARGQRNGPVAGPVKVDEVIAKLQKHPDAVQHWNVDKAGLDDLLDQLSKKPGIHTVHVFKNGMPRATLPDAQMGSQ